MTWPISSTLPLPNRVAGVSRRSGATRRLADLQVERQGQADGLLQARLGVARGAAALPVGMDDEGALDRRLAVNGL